VPAAFPASLRQGKRGLACPVFVTDHTHQQALERQLADTTVLMPLPGTSV
jgi:hypothetical protein